MSSFCFVFIFACMVFLLSRLYYFLFAEERSRLEKKAMAQIEEQSEKEIRCSEVRDNRQFSSKTIISKLMV